MDSDYLQELKAMRYRLVGGGHGAVKVCHWTKESLLRDRRCYKEQFYGISSHRCLQMTPNVFCMQRCLFCWRPHTYGDAPEGLKWADAETIIEESIAAQIKLLEGYKGLPGRVDARKFEEANEPNQVAISLDGEPTAYPFISELVDGFQARGFTTFVVTNGLLPDVLAKMSLPTQLYVSLDATDKEMHHRINVPMWPDAWERLNQTLELLPSLDTRKVIRITTIKGMNMVKPEDYAKLIEKSQSDMVEVKSYMFVGASRRRMTIANMPSHEETKEFALEILKHLPGYEFVDEKADSRVVLLSNGKKPKLIPK